MCGIAGLMLSSGALKKKQLSNMAVSLNHRGPDESDILIQGAVGMAHTRLSIMDVEGGHQPFQDESKQILIANGEIYNSPELRKQFPDYPFKTGSDCEVLLPLYQKYGLNFTKHLRGMYAIALFDPKTERLVISRDSFGIKPLYYHQAASSFVFGSEPRAIIASGEAKPSVNKNALVELLQTQFICGQKTLFDGIYRVLPGETLVVEKGRLVQQFVTPLEMRHSEEIPSSADALSLFGDVMKESVIFHQRSDVEYGLFLSGGVDSAILLKLMEANMSSRLKTYTVGFQEGTVHDERSHAAMLAKEMGADHQEIIFTEKDFWRLLPKAVEVADDPVIDYAMLPTLKMAEEASKDLKVVLCGEGGDELFAGYGRYRRALRPKWLGGRKIRSKGVFDKSDVLTLPLRDWRKHINEQEKSIAKHNIDSLQRIQWLDMQDWLAHGLLTKLDRCLMAFGLEGRTPFLDKNVFDFAFHLPKSFKISKKIGKILPKTWLDKNFPQSQPFTKKRGFTVPVADWILARKGEVAHFLRSQKGIAEITNEKNLSLLLESMDKKNMSMIWFLLFYGLWHERHVIGNQDTLFDFK